MPRRHGVKIWKILKKMSSDYGVEKLSSYHGAEKLSSDHGVEKLVSENDVEKLWSNHGVEKLRLDHEMMPNVAGVVNIVWLRKTFKNSVSLLVSKNRRQKFINRSYLNNEVHFFFLPLFVFACICSCLRICMAIQHLPTEQDVSRIQWILTIMHRIMNYDSYKNIITFLKGTLMKTFTFH